MGIIIKNMPKVSNIQSEKKVPENETEPSVAPIPIKKLTIKDIVPPSEKMENSEKLEKSSGKGVKSVVSPKAGQNTESKTDSRIVKPLSIKLNQSNPEVKKPEVGKQEAC